MKTKINTYEKFTDGFARLGWDSLPCDGSPERRILERIDKNAGGAKIEFLPLNDEAFASLTECLESAENYGNESYIIEVSDVVRIYYTSRITKLYALYAIERVYQNDGIPCGIIYNTPKLETRCFRTYLPARWEMNDYFDLIDYLIAFGHNSIMIEIGGATY